MLPIPLARVTGGTAIPRLPIMLASPRRQASRLMTLASGARLGQYEVLAPLGAGATVEVFA
jgi:hypothetical protein